MLNLANPELARVRSDPTARNKVTAHEVAWAMVFVGLPVAYGMAITASIVLFALLGMLHECTRKVYPAQVQRWLTQMR